MTAGATETEQLEAETEQGGSEYIVTNTATVTIDGTSALSGSSVSISDVTFTTYRVLYATYDEDSNAFEWHLTNWAADALVKTSGADGITTFATEEAAIAAISGITTSGTGTSSTTEQNAIINYLASYVKTASPAISTYSVSWSKSGNKATKNLPVGGYLVLAGNSNMSFLNMFVSVDVEGTSGTASNQWIVSANNVVLKGKVISIEKGVNDSGTSSTYSDTADAQVGDTVYYEITVPVPQFAIDCKTYLFQIVDTPSNVAIDFDSVTVKAGTWSAQNTVDPGSATLLYRAVYNSSLDTWSYVDTSNTSDPKNAGGYTAVLSSQDSSLTIDFSDLYLATFYDATSQTYPYDYVYITYSAEVLSTAVTTLETGNGNTAELTYGSSYTTSADHNEGESKAKVNTYQLKLTKTATNGTNTTLSNAEFEVFYYVTEGTGVDTKVTEYTLSFIQNSDGSYEVVDSTDTPTSTTVKTDDNGTLTLIGLDSDKVYYIQEVVAPSGYSLNENVATFKITVDNSVSLSSSDSVEYTGFERGDQTGTNAEPGGSSKTVVSTSKSWTIGTDSVTVGTESVTEVSLTVTDTKIAALPATGSVGIIVFTIAGVAIMILALILINGGKSKEKAGQGMKR